MKHVLVIDDDDKTRRYLRCLFEDEGYAVDEAVDGHEGLAFLRAAPYSYLVLLDYLMPNFNGFDVLRAVHAEPGLFQRHAIIIMTSLKPVVPRELAYYMTRTNIPLLGKPFDLDELFEAVEDGWQRLL